MRASITQMTLCSPFVARLIQKRAVYTSYPRRTYKSNDAHVVALREAISKGSSLPSSTGTFAVEPKDLVLYYGKPAPDNILGRLDFANATKVDTRQLAEACEPATFGLGSENVFDENYRKAGKLNSDLFSPKFDPEHSGLMNTVREVMLEDHGAGQSIRAELYKINVYRPGSFFRPHKDTPRAENMCGSLVIVYPTAHEGSALRFKHDNIEFVFDSAKAVSVATEPCVAFVAFYGDVEHEVLPVLSGYRVTLTYNLYYTNATPSSLGSGSLNAYEDALRCAFQNFLKDKTCLPDGGNIGFGLRHEYPIDKSGKKQKRNGFRSIKHLYDRLKGTDATLLKVCREMALNATLKAVYVDDGVFVICSGTVDKGRDTGEDSNLWCDILNCGGKSVSNRENDYGESCGLDIDVQWATDVVATNINIGEISYLTYGNEPDMGFAYITFCLLVKVPVATTR